MKMHCVPFLSIEIYMTKSSMPNVPFMQFTFVAYVQFKHIFVIVTRVRMGGDRGWRSVHVSCILRIQLKSRASVVW